MDPRAVPLALARARVEAGVGGAVAVPAATSDDVVLGAGAVRTGRDRIRFQRSLADTVGPSMRLLLVGLNPSLYAADAGVPYARPGNRCWPALRAAGLVVVDRDPIAALVDHGVGMTDLVKRATVAASEVTVAEFQAGAARVERLVTWLEPDAVAFTGLAGYRASVDRTAVVGWQARRFGGRPSYVLPSPSGRNAHVRLDDLVAHLTAAARRPPRRLTAVSRRP